MPAPLAKGLIIAASVLVAAGIAIYESPQVRDWVDNSRRKLALALHALGDDMQPRRTSESESEVDAREERIRRRRNELVRRAREEGVAVDLDELVRAGREGSDRGKSFDELVGEDGCLRAPVKGTATGVEAAGEARKRAGAGFAVGAAVANPFSDDNVLFDVGDSDDDADADAKPLVDLTSDVAEAEPEAEAESEATIEAESKSELTNAHSQSIETETFHSATLPPAASLDSTAIYMPATATAASTGTLTPPSRPSSAASMVDSAASDVGVLSMLDDASHNDTDAFSDGGFTDAFSEAGFSDVGGALTPSSWTDVGSDDGEGAEWGAGAGAEWGNGHGVSQVQQ